MAIVKIVAGERVTRVPMDKVRTIGSAVHLECPGRDLGLHRSETAAGKWVPQRGAL
jgi:hypothetical protein